METTIDTKSKIALFDRASS